MILRSIQLSRLSESAVHNPLTSGTQQLNKGMPISPGIWLDNTKPTL